MVQQNVCQIENNKLQEVVECSVEQVNNQIIATPQDSNENKIITEDTIVSMNLLLFTPDIFNILTERFIDFLTTNQNDLSQKEYQIPSVLDYCIKTNQKEIDVLETTAKWYGVTYKEDKESVKQAIKKLVDNNKYPINLWKN